MFDYHQAIQLEVIQQSSVEEFLVVQPENIFFSDAANTPYEYSTLIPDKNHHYHNS